MNFAIFGPAYGYIDGELDRFLNQGLSNVIGEVAGPTRLALVLYVTLYGFAILRGAIAEPFIDFAVRSLKLAIVHMLATSVAYGDWVAEPLFEVLPAALAQAISGASVQDPGESFDKFFARAAYLGETISDTATPVNISPWLMAVVVYLAAALAAALGFGVVIFAKVALALVVAVGPIFVACTLFEATRRWFFGWLSQAVNYLVLFALILTIFELILSLVDAQWSTIEGQDPVVGGLLFIALCLLATIFFFQTPAMAAGIAGGASAGLADFASAGGRVAQSIPTSVSAPSRSRPAAGGSIRPAGALR